MKKRRLTFCLKDFIFRSYNFLAEVSFENRRLAIINGLIFFKDVLIAQQYLYRPVTTKISDGFLLSIEFDE